MQQLLAANISELIAGKDIEQTSIEELVKLVKTYPYFGAGQVLLTKKLKDTKKSAYETQLQRTALHVKNPYWLDFVLNESVYNTPVITEEAIETNEVPEDVLLDTIIDIQPDMIAAGNAAIIEELIHQEDVHETIIDEPVIENVEHSTISTETTNEFVEAETISPVEEIVHHQAEQETIVDEPVIESVEHSTISTETINEFVEAETISPVEEIIHEEDVHEAIVDEPFIENVEHSTIPTETENEFVEAETISPVEEIIHEKDVHEAIVDEPVIENVEHSTISTETENVSQPIAAASAITEIKEDVVPEEHNEKMASLLKSQLEAFKKPVEAEATLPVETESYHTVDYFASQGIKITAELKKMDEFGVKVRKFTDWLKQMKRANPQPADLGTDEAAEHMVEDMAAVSNKSKDVITEAMAEVFAKQGMITKAIEVYLKLSFLNPDKSAYFAAKIQDLKVN